MTRPLRPLLDPGTRVGPWEIGEPIASGGYGTVYRATGHGDGEPAAVKVLHPELSASREAVLRFEREVRSIRVVRHPGVVDIRDFGYLAGRQPYFAMELLTGETVRSRLRRSGALDVGQVLAVLEPLCSALEAAHAKGVVHRDVKASNVYLAGDQPPGPEIGRVVLLDFGVAKLLDDAGPVVTLTHHAVGSTPCMSPEQITGDDIDPRTDIYGLGVLLFHMLAGTLPFDDKRSAVVWDMHLRVPPPRISERATVPAALDDVLAAAMAKSPDDRPITPTDLLERFRAAVGGAGEVDR